jgi:hypothetical protein
MWGKAPVVSPCATEVSQFSRVGSGGRKGSDERCWFQLSGFPSFESANALMTTFLSRTQKGQASIVIISADRLSCRYWEAPKASSLSVALDSRSIPHYHGNAGNFKVPGIFRGSYLWQPPVALSLPGPWMESDLVLLTSVEHLRQSCRKPWRNLKASGVKACVGLSEEGHVLRLAQHLEHPATHLSIWLVGRNKAPFSSRKCISGRIPRLC